MVDLNQRPPACEDTAADRNGARYLCVALIVRFRCIALACPLVAVSVAELAVSRSLRDTGVAHNAVRFSWRSGPKDRYAILSGAEGYRIFLAKR